MDRCQVVNMKGFVGAVTELSTDSSSAMLLKGLLVQNDMVCFVL